MKFSKREDIEAPIQAVFEAVSDFHALERAALRRGIEVARLDDRADPAPGMAWAISAPIRGKRRDISLTLVEFAPGTGLAADAASGGITGHVTVDLVALSRSRTRMQFGLDLRASTLSARRLLQSMKLAKATLDRRFARRIADIAAEIERRHAGPGRAAAGFVR
jgi:hypothetical protein